ESLAGPRVHLERGNRAEGRSPVRSGDRGEPFVEPSRAGEDIDHRDSHVPPKQLVGAAPTERADAGHGSEQCLSSVDIPSGGTPSDATFRARSEYRPSMGT